MCMFSNCLLQVNKLLNAIRKVLITDRCKDREFDEKVGNFASARIIVLVPTLTCH